MDPRHHRASGGLLCISQGYYGDYSGVRHKGRLRGESLDRLGNPTFRLGLQSQEQSQEQLHEDQLITDTADLKMTEDALSEDTAKTQRKIA